MNNNSILKIVINMMWKSYKYLHNVKKWTLTLLPISISFNVCFNSEILLVMNTNSENAIFRNMQMKASLPTIFNTFLIGIVK